ncbi:hypothetical protein Tco_0817122 [Tanacetum coccineum]
MKRISSRRCGGSVGGKVGGGGGNVRGNGRIGGSMSRRGGGSLAKCSVDSKEGLVGAGGGEVKGGGIDFGVSKSLLGEILGVAIGEGSGDPFGDDGGAVWRPSQWRCSLSGHCHEGSDDEFQYVWYESGEQDFCLG